MAGRYYLFHLWPLTLAELGEMRTSLDRFLEEPLQVATLHAEEMKSIWDRLSRFSGFPEPYLAAKPSTYRRWSATYHRRLVREDIRDLTDIRAVEDMETLFYLLPSRVGAPLSIPSLAMDLKVAYNTLRNWLSIFERFLPEFQYRSLDESYLQSDTKREENLSSRLRVDQRCRRQI